MGRVTKSVIGPSIDRFVQNEMNVVADTLSRGIISILQCQQYEKEEVNVVSSSEFKTTKNGKTIKG